MAHGGAAGISVFVSYSRQDYHVAEALHAGLAATAGLRPWMDVADLRLGHDWSAAIDAALDAADVLVLVGSPAAFASAHVRDECRRAADRGVPVVLAVAADPGRAPDVPVAAVHDLRPDLRAGIAAVGADVLGGLRSPRPPYSPRYRPPAAVVAVAACLLAELVLVGLALAWTVASVASPIEPEFRIHSSLLGDQVVAFSGAAAFGPVVLSATALVMTVLAVRSFARRRLDPAAFAFGRLLVFAVVAFVAVLVQTIRRRQVLSQLELPALLELALRAAVPVVVATAAVAVASSVLVRFSPAVLRHTRTGRAGHRVRRTLLGEQAVPPPPAGTVRHTFRLLHDKQDRGLADVLRHECLAAGLVETADPRWTILLVTNESDPVRVEQTVASAPDGLICLLGSPVRIPEDSWALRRRQWLDFRRHDPAVLQTLLREMTTDGWAGRRLPVPIDPAAFRVPDVVASDVVNPLLGLGLAVAVAAGLLMSTTMPDGGGVAVVLAAAFAVLSGRLAAGVAGRTYTRERHLLDSVLSQVVLVAGVVTAVTWFAPSVPVAVAYVVFGLLEIVTVLLPWSLLARTWLLPAPPTRSHRNLRGLAGQAPGVAVLAALVFSLVLALGIAPKPDLYWSNGYELGALHPNTSLPERLALDNHTYLSGLRWSEPSYEQVTATGVINVNDCTPDCADGTYSALPVTVVASDPRVCVVAVHVPYSDDTFGAEIDTFTAITLQDPGGTPVTYSFRDTERTEQQEIPVRCDSGARGD